MEQIAAFLTETTKLYALLQGRSGEQLDAPTGFKSWRINDIVRHLHFWNIAADLSLRDEAGFLEFYEDTKTNILDGTLPSREYSYLRGLSGPDLIETWHDFAKQMSTAFSAADPKRRVVWAGPSMSARSSITARYMETWAHGQAVFDALGETRHNTDDIFNIVFLGKNTFGWSFANRGLDIPPQMPRLELTAPSGAVWTFGDEGAPDTIRGAATAFCQVVTQVRNIADVALSVEGDTAARWMEIAQCFAGPPETPPAKGQRRLAAPPR